MDLIDRIREVEAEYPESSQDPAELQRLQRFVLRMKAAGILRAHGYDLPLPDTLGRAAVTHQARPQFKTKDHPA